MTVITPDAKLQHDVERELAWDIRIDAVGIGVAAHHGVITLTGTVRSWAEKHAIEEAAYRVADVRAIANDIEIKPTWENRLSDTEIAESVRIALVWNRMHDRVRATVADHGAVTLTGSVATLRDRDEVERIVRSLHGVRDVTNEVILETPLVPPEALKKSIEHALARRASRHAMQVSIAVDGSTVVLQGSVGSWGERRAIVGAARGTAGVRHVEDKLFFI
jgi:osmotically-inducible protein OsmY